MMLAVFFVVAVAAAFTAGRHMASTSSDQESAIISREDATREDFEWGSLYTFFSGETFGTKDGLKAAATIKAGMQIHPPHIHEEEEFMVVVSGEGTWHLKGEEVPARVGDVLYAAPWDIHGITNTGPVPLTFIVWKWNSKGVELPPQPE